MESVNGKQVHLLSGFKGAGSMYSTDPTVPPPTSEHLIAIRHAMVGVIPFLHGMVCVYDAGVQGMPWGESSLDASGNLGCGAYNSLRDQFQFQWPESWLAVHIMVKELLPIIMDCAILCWEQMKGKDHKRVPVI